MLRPGEEDDSASNSGDEQSAAAAEQAAVRQAPADEELEAESWRTWEVLWKAGGGEGRLQRLTFQGPDATRAFLQQHMSQASEAWSLSMASMQGSVPAAHLTPPPPPLLLQVRAPHLTYISC